MGNLGMCTHIMVTHTLRLVSWGARHMYWVSWGSSCTPTGGLLCIVFHSVESRFMSSLISGCVIVNMILSSRETSRDTYSVGCQMMPALIVNIITSSLGEKFG